MNEVKESWPWPSNQIKIVHQPGFNNKGGVSFAYRKTTPFKNCKMVEVAVAYCSDKDTFCRKTGRTIALDNFYQGKTVLVPARTNNDDYTIPQNLRYMFWDVL